MNHQQFHTLSQLLPPPVEARHAEYSMLFSADDDPGAMSPELIQISLDAVREALIIDLSDLAHRCPSCAHYIHTWPGEHYKLLAGLVKVLAPRCIVEIGTDRGLSALAMKQVMPAHTQLFSFDVVPWKDIDSPALSDADFHDGRMVQIIGDLKNAHTFISHREILQSADFIFLDGPKDGIFEEIILENMHSLSFSSAPLIFLDDIRLWNMLKIWRSIAMPKCDLTSFGHWSGSGLVQWIQPTNQ